MKLILGSQSKGRRGVLERAGYQFETMSADIDEKAVRSDDPEVLTLTLAHAKADALLPKIHEPAFLITSDQVVFCHGKILEKPETDDEVRAFFSEYAKYPCQTVCAVVVVNTKTQERREGIDIATVTFREVPSKVVEELIEERDVFSRAGAFSIEEPKIQDYIVDVDGTLDSVIGLPLALTKRLLKEAGF